MAKLKFYYSTMRAGKSTLALQINDNYQKVGRIGVLFTSNSRSGRSCIESRIGLSKEATNINKTFDIYGHVKELSKLFHIDYMIFDDVQFYTAKQINQIADLVDEFDIDCFCFGLKTDFRGVMFESAVRLMEIADEIKEIEVKALCWCGKKGVFNARIDDLGYMVYVGEVEVIGDSQYEVLCREHFNKGMTLRAAKDDGLV